MNRRPTISAPTRKIVFVDQPGAPQSVILAFGVGLPRSSPDYAPVTVMNTMLGGLFSARINMNLREKNGFTYGAFSQYVFRRGAGPFLAGAQVRSDVTAPAVHELFNELGRIRTEPLSTRRAAHGEGQRDPFAAGRFRKPQSRSPAVPAACGSITCRSITTASFPAMIEAVNAEDTSRVANQYVHPENFLLITVGDRSKVEAGLQDLKLGPIEMWSPEGEPVQGGGTGAGKMQ